MSKSLGNAIAVEDSPKEIYGKTLSIPDALMWDWLLLLTDLPKAEIDAKRQRAVGAGDLHPKPVKQELARQPGRRVPRRGGGRARPRPSSSASSPAAVRRMKLRVSLSASDSGALSAAGSESSVKVGACS